MTTPADRDPVATAQGLTAALGGMSAELSRLGAYGKRNRHLIWGLAVSLVLDLILTIGFALATIQAHDASARAVQASTAARHASASNLALCQAGNTSRAQQIGLWRYIISISKPPATAQDRAVVAKFEHHLTVLFRPRDCAALGKKG